MSIFTKVAMNVLMNNSHPEIDRKQCWNLHPHKEQCTDCKDICPYGDDVFSRPNLAKDWDLCADCGAVRVGLPAPAASPLPASRSRKIWPRRAPTTRRCGSAASKAPATTTSSAPAWAP